MYKYIRIRRMQMEKLNKYERIFGDRAEKRIELEATLPEYLPSCAEILRVTARATNEKQVSGSAVTIVGKVVFSVLYASDTQDSLRTAAFTADLEHSFSLPGDRDFGDEALVECLASVVGEEARILSPRRLLLSCVAAIRVNAVVRREFELPDFPDDGTIVKKTALASTVEAADLPNLEIHLSETVNPGADAPKVGEIVVADCRLGQPSQNVRDGKCVFSGDAYLSFIYSDAENVGNYVTFSKSIPYTAEASGDFSEDSTVLCRAIPVKVSAEPKVDSYGDSSGIGLSVVGRLCGRSYRKCAVEYCEDAFGTECEVDIEKQTIATDVMKGRISDSAEMCEDVTVRLGGITEIVTADIEVCDTEASISQGKITAVSSAVLRILGRDGEGRLESTAAPFDIKFTARDNVDADLEGAKIDSTLCACKTSAKIENGSVKVCFTAHLDAVIIATDSICAVLSAVPDESRAVSRDNSRYVICYPSSDDTAWSVAKRYRVSPDALRSVNGLSDDSLSGKHCIIIPR